MKRAITKEYCNYLIEIWNANEPWMHIEPVTSDNPQKRNISRLIGAIEKEMRVRGYLFLDSGVCPRKYEKIKELMNGKQKIQK